MPIDNPDWLHNEEHDHLYDLSCSLTQLLQRDYGEGVQVQCGFENRVGYHFRIHGLANGMLGKAADRARDWLSANTPYRFELQADEL